MNKTAHDPVTARDMLAEAGDGAAIRCVKEVVKNRELRVTERACTTKAAIDNFYQPRSVKCKPPLSSHRTDHFGNRKGKEVKPA